MLKRLSLFLILSLGFWGLGCYDNATDPETDSGNFSLDDQFDGFNASDERPGFGDSALLAQAGENEEYTDPVLALAEVDSFLADDESGFYHLRIVWGRLCVDSTVSVATDWSGSLSVNRGAEIIRGVIRFEPNHDYILPRTDRKLIEWVSRTSIHNDGIAVDIVIPRPRPVLDSTTLIDISPEDDTVVTIVIDTAYPVLDPVEMVFETGPYSSTFTLTEISALDTVIYLDDSNAVAIHGLKLDHRPCARGFLSGVWGHDEEGEGVFKGVWISRNGKATGYLKGNYGVNDGGVNVIKGKWISLSGEFRGFVVGTYKRCLELEVDDATLEHAGGAFRGVIYSPDRLAVGVLKGRFISALSDDEGFFQGRWRVICPDPDDQSDDLEENF